MITCLTLSPAKVDMNIPRFLAYVNHVSVFDDMEGLHAARVEAIYKVKTEAFFFQDMGDELPSSYPPPRQGLIYGDTVVYDAVTLATNRVSTGTWNAAVHRVAPMYIRRAICKTAYAQQIAALLPKGAYLTEPLLYYFLAKHYGSEYESTLTMKWNREPMGLHTRSRSAVRNTITWLGQNEDRISAHLTQHKLP